jgi:hypothetical protein
LNITGLNALEFLDCSYNFFADKNSVIGFEGVWDDVNFIFGTQNSPPDEGIIVWILIVAIVAMAAIIAVYFFFIRPKK